MAKFEALIEINPEKVETLSEYIAYCKYYLKSKSEEQIGNYLFKRNKKFVAINKNKSNNLKEDFSFLYKKFQREFEQGILNGNLFNILKKYKSNETLKDFPLNWLKYEIIGDSKIIDFKDDYNIKKIKQISGIYEKEEIQKLQNYIQKLPKYSFAIWFKFNLKAPYFSKDDDEFYIIQNPILKETNFKVPMVRVSSLKGALAHAFRKLFEKETDIDGKREKIESFLRIFGAGSDSIKAIENYIFDKSKDLKKAKEKILEFILFELGLELTKNDIDEINKIDSKEKLKEIIKNKLSKKLEEENNLPLEFQTHKGRAIFYPTYFDKLSLEIINPHDRRKRAGINPIHYEVVPPETEGIFQLIYIPFDGILKNDEEVKKEAKEDLKNLCEAIEILSNEGIGAKTKLGWGRFEISNKMICINEDLSITRGIENVKRSD